MALKRLCTIGLLDRGMGLFKVRRELGCGVQLLWSIAVTAFQMTAMGKPMPSVAAVVVDPSPSYQNQSFCGFPDLVLRCRIRHVSIYPAPHLLWVVFNGQDLFLPPIQPQLSQI
jgi:hypothetical protein